MLENVNNLQVSVHLSPLMIDVQSDGRQDQAHLYDRRLRPTSGAGEPVIHLITGMPFPPLFVSDLRWGWECPGS